MRTDEQRAKWAAKMRQYRAANPDKVRQYEREYYAKNREARNALMRKWRAANPEKKIAINRRWYLKNRERVLEQSRQWRAANKDKQRQHGRKRLGIINPPSEKKVGKCEICRKHTDLLCDHDHATGLQRGWLCRKCNWSLEWSLENSRRALKYIQRHQARKTQSQKAQALLFSS